MRGSAGRIMIRPGQAIMIAWLTTAHAPLWEPAHERAPPQKSLQFRKDLKKGCLRRSKGQRRVEIRASWRTTTRPHGLWSFEVSMKVMPLSMTAWRMRLAWGWSDVAAVPDAGDSIEG